MFIKEQNCRASVGISDQGVSLLCLMELPAATPGKAEHDAVFGLLFPHGRPR